MKSKLLLLTCLCSFFMLTSCANVGGCCGYSYYDYYSNCGLSNCAGNYGLATYANPCPGPYNCYAYY